MCVYIDIIDNDAVCVGMPYPSKYALTTRGHDELEIKRKRAIFIRFSRRPRISDSLYIRLRARR